VKSNLRISWTWAQSHHTNRMQAHAAKGMVIVALLLVSGLALSQEGQAPAESTEAQASEAVNPTTEGMKALIATKNVFEPKKKPKPIPPPDLSGDPVLPNIGPQRLLRPFRVKGFFQTPDGQSKASLYFEESGQYLDVSVDERIETITILAIEATSLLCDYDGVEVRIELRETSNDAWNRIRGLSTGSQPKLVCTVIPVSDEGGPSNEPYAYFSFAGQKDPIKIHVGDKIGLDEVVKIEHERVTFKDQYGSTHYMDTTVTAP